MGVRESLLNTITSVADSDFVRIVTSAGASSKATVQNLAKAIIENYTGSSLAGSSQSVKSALDALNSKMGGISFTKTSISGATSFNLPNGYRGSLYIHDSATNNNGEYFVLVTTQGVVATRAALTASNITIDTSVANKLTLTPASGARFIVFRNVNHQATIA